MNRPDDLIEAAWEARRKGNYRQAEQDLLQAITASRHDGSRLQLIRALKALAHVVRDLDQADRALPLYEEAITLSRDEGDGLLLAHTVRHLGDLHRESGRLAQAGRCYEEALSLYRAVCDPSPLDFANALRSAAILREAEGDVEAAQRLWVEARRLYEVAGVLQGVEECDRRLSAR